MVNTEHGWRGGENQVFLLVRGLSHGRFRAITACQEGGDLEHRLDQAGEATLPLRARGGLDPWAARRLKRCLREEQIELVHAHASHAHTLCALAGLGTGLPLLVSRRVDFPLRRGVLNRWKYVRATRVVAVSEGVAVVLQAGGVRSERIDIIHDGVDPGRVAKAGSSTLRADLGIPKEAVVFGITAFLTEHKDHRTLLQAFRQVEAALPSAWLLIAGEGELAGELTTLSRELGLSRCRFLGFRPDVEQVLGALDVFVLSSRLEGLGSSLMDAMFAGLPVVATSVGGVPELVDDGVNGLLVPPVQHEQLAQALLRTGEDAGLRARMGAAGRAKAQTRFSAERMVREYEAVYDRMLGQA